MSSFSALSPLLACLATSMLHSSNSSLKTDSVRVSITEYMASMKAASVPEVDTMGRRERRVGSEERIKSLEREKGGRSKGLLAECF